MFPKADLDIFFPQWRKRYGAGGVLRCKGDGISASVGLPEWAEGLEITGKDERGLTKVDCKGDLCPYTEKGDCKSVGSLQVLLPELKGVGVWQITTGSWNSIVNMNSAIEWLTSICGRYWMIPLRLMRVEITTQSEGRARKHHVLQVDQEHFSLADIQRLAIGDHTKVFLGEAMEDPDTYDDARPVVKTYRLENREQAPEAAYTGWCEEKGPNPSLSANTAKPEIAESGTATEAQKSAIEKLRIRLGWEEVPGVILADLTYEEAGKLIEEMSRRWAGSHRGGGGDGLAD